jgi:hypothetical protein
VAAHPEIRETVAAANAIAVNWRIFISFVVLAFWTITG